MRASMICLICLIVTAICDSRVSAEAVLMGDWDLSQVHDGVAPDRSGNHMDGLVYGNPTSLGGGGLHFDGVDDYIEIPNTSG